MDSFVMNNVEMAIDSMASGQLTVDCMDSEGHDWESVPVTEAQLDDPVSSPSGLRIFNSDIAAAYGYQYPSVFPEEVFARRSALNSLPLSPEKDAALTTCARQAYDRLGSNEAQDLSNTMNGYAGESWQGAMADDAVKEAAGEWRSCLAPAGIPDLPDAPYGDDAGMPTQSMVARWGGDEGDVAVSGPASLAEVEAAVADAECRMSSGYTDAFYLAMWRLQSQALIDNPSIAADGQRARLAYEEMLAKARAVIAAQGGT